MRDDVNKTVLVAIMNNKRDFAIAREKHWYHGACQECPTEFERAFSGTSYGSINVGSLTPAQPGYIFLVGGDRGNGDYFDNVGVR